MTSHALTALLTSHDLLIMLQRGGGEWHFNAKDDKMQADMETSTSRNTIVSDDPVYVHSTGSECYGRTHRIVETYAKIHDGQLSRMTIAVTERNQRDRIHRQPKHTVKCKSKTRRRNAAREAKAQGPSYL